MTPRDGSGEGIQARVSGSVSPRQGRRPGSILRVWLASSYNSFYQTIYGYENTFAPPEALLAYLEPLLVTTEKQLETLFVLWNAAQRRSPFEDSQAVQ